MRNDQPTVAVLGGRGYLGRELLRLLARHPLVGEILAASDSVADEAISSHLPGFHGDARFCRVNDALERADVVFSASPGGQAPAHAAAAGDRVFIDLSRDHRGAALAAQAWHYGMADLWPPAPGCKRIANPGCYPTATTLAAYPALRSGRTQGPLIADGKSGVTGAGATPRADLHFPATNESTRAYKVVGHDHQAEIRGIAERCGHQGPVRFTPHLIPQNRGLLLTLYLPTDLSDAAAKALYAEAYADATFIRFGVEPDTAAVRGTNYAHVAVDVDDGLLVARCAIDNLVKGGAGQAIQNMNHVLGFAPDTGLEEQGSGI